MKFEANKTKPESFHIPIDRRRFFKSMALVSAGFTLPSYLAEALTVSPIVTQGPYYPLANNIPLDKNNELVQLNDNLTIASGMVTYLSGRVLDNTGNPVRGALVELWHADREGDYLYSASATRNPACDANFAGFGQFLTGASGQFLFRTINAWPLRRAHPSFSCGRYDSRAACTFDDADLLERGGQGFERYLDYTAVPGTTTNEVQATWDFVSGFTPVEPTYPGGGLALAGLAVTGPTSGSARYKITLPAYTGYTYEIYGNPTLADLAWQALPFSLTQTGAIDRNKYTAASNGTIDLYVEQKAVKGFYYVSFRVPGANTGTP